MYEVNHWGQLSLFRIESKKTRGITPLFCFVVTRKNNQKVKKDDEKVLTRITKGCII